MTCRQLTNARVTDEMYAETERIQALLQLNNDIAMASRAFEEGRTEIEGDLRQKILDCMLDNEASHITARQLLRLMN
jgi:hypothetical protein